MLVVVILEWTSQTVPKVIETRLKNPTPPEIKTLAEAVLFGQHKLIGVYDAPDEKSVFKAFAPYLGITNFTVMPATTVDEGIKIATGK